MNKEELIYQMEKDQPMLSAKEIKNRIAKKYNISDEICNRLSIRITNYQIDKYGQIVDKRTGKCTKNDRQVNNRRASQRRYKRVKENS